MSPNEVNANGMICLNFPYRSEGSVGLATKLGILLGVSHWDTFSQRMLRHLKLDVTVYPGLGPFNSYRKWELGI